MECPYRKMCDRYPDCPTDNRKCRLFDNFMRRFGEREIKPVEWKPGRRE
ncbi:MAG: hypothetical protein NT129_04065 [Candidatus Aenigmarchaeota archaeon]|nr:hypothetical protein [Candidatus Aenigmarchaeota archaeon]